MTFSRVAVKQESLRQRCLRYFAKQNLVLRSNDRIPYYEQRGRFFVLRKEGSPFVQKDIERKFDSIEELILFMRGKGVIKPHEYIDGIEEQGGYLSPQMKKGSRSGAPLL
jgi:hypothetical protein